MLNLRSATIPSDEDLIRWSLDHPGYRFEYVNGEITIVSPTGGKSGIRNSALHAKLYAWAKANGYEIFGSNTGFVFGTSSMLKVSPDEALVKTERFSALSEDDREKLVPLAPDIAVELVSKSQEYGKKRGDVIVKCKAMFENGVEHVVMLDPYATIGAERVRAWGEPPPDFPNEWDDVLDA
jgi:Uma2 family endonuclease